MGSLGGCKLQERLTSFSKKEEPCPLCESLKKELLYPSTLEKVKAAKKYYTCTTTGYGIHGPIYKCRDCSFVYIVDDNSLEEINTSYEQVQDALYISEEAGRVKTFSRHLKNLNKICPKNGNLLEVGAYTGLFLSMARDCGWKVKGIEPSRWAVSQAKKLYGISIKQGILKPNYFKKETFNAVVMWDVIEHLPNPLESLCICNAYLKTGGWIAMSTIDIGSLAAKILGPRWPWLMEMHRVYFSKATIKRMLEMAGFVKISFRPHIRFVSISYLVSRFALKQGIIPHQIGNIIIPFYVGDIFEVYAQKPK